MRQSKRLCAGALVIDRDIYLLHQVHPAKLANDVLSGLLSTALIWRRRVRRALLAGFIPAALAWSLVIRGDLSPLRATRRGRYVLEHMPPAAQAVRPLGQVAMRWAAYRRRPAGIVVGARHDSDRLVTRTASKETLSCEMDPGGLHYQITGEGEPVVVPHPGFADSRIWDPAMAAIRGALPRLALRHARVRTVPDPLRASHVRGRRRSAARPARDPTRRSRRLLARWPCGARARARAARPRQRARARRRRHSRSTRDRP
jgi:hypothetical protein